MQGGSKRPRMSATLDETGGWMVAAKYPSIPDESRNTGTLPTGDDVRQQ